MKCFKKSELIRLANSILDYYAKTVYFEYPVENSDGEIIGYEWHGLRIGAGHVFFNSCKDVDDLSTDHNAHVSDQSSERGFYDKNSSQRSIKPKHFPCAQA